MKNVYVKAYFKRNLGDDLLVKILSNRYENMFTIISRPKYKYNNEFQNIRVYNSFSYYIAKIYEIFANFFRVKDKYILEKFAIKKTDIIVRIGGSIFIEDSYLSNLEVETNVYKYNKPYYILGANFGPYKTKKYKKYVENNIIKNAKDVCFRDNYSYSLFKNNYNVRKSSDIVFSLDTSNVKITNRKRVVISVIDCDKKNIGNREIYEHKIIEMIEFFVKMKYEVVLMSFCKFEGDETAIKRIYNSILNDEVKNSVHKYFYRENIIEALNVIGDSRIVVGSRFHANILGLVMKKTIIPIVYSDKTLEMLNDLNFKGKIFDIRDINNFDIKTIFKEHLDYKLDVTSEIESSVKQFEELDKILERSEKND